MSDSNFERSAFRILSAMFNNVHFLTPKPDAAVMKTMVQEFPQAVNDCKTGDRSKIAEKNAKRKLLEEVLLNEASICSWKALTTARYQVAAVLPFGIR